MQACQRPGKAICDLHARLPADYDEAQDYGVQFRSSADGDWTIVRLCALPGVRAWVGGALAEKDFRDFEEPYRLDR